MSEWDYVKVYDVIKLRLEEIHHLGISHNDVRPRNIFVSVTGKISLIDFGLSACPSSEDRKKRDFEALDQIFKRVSYSNQEENSEKNGINPNNYGNGGDDVINSSDEGIFDKGNEESQAIGQTKEEISSTVQQKNKVNTEFSSFVLPGTQDTD